VKAIVYAKYGTPDQLELKEVDKPVPREDEVLVKVHAAAINDWDLALLTGKPLVYRLLTGLLKPKIRILGCDVAGRVEAVGGRVKQFHPGDEVFGDICEYGFGAFAEYVCVPENALALKPGDMTFEEAAAIPQAGMLAVQGLLDKGQIKPRQKLLINGAGGGVGTFAVQIAKLYGIEVTGVDHSGKLDMMRSMGFDHVMDYTKEDFSKNGQCYNLILDNKTNRSPFAYVRALCPNGIYVTTGGSPVRLLQALFLGPFISLITKKRIRMVALKPNKDLAYVKELYESGKIKPMIEGPFALAEIAEAFRLFAAGAHRGKVVITMKSSDQKN